MKKILIAVTLFIVAFSMNAQIAKPVEDFDANAPIFQFEEEVIDYGKIKKDADGNRVFKFKNTGGSPLIITQTKGSCGCTVPTYQKEPIMPGETGEIKVKYATNRVGRFSKTVTITSNASEPKKVVRIKGEVLKLEESK
tara:strand:- start:18579 stop:18995 length:417 start_codon:yes stop_codon:yes gene_type:complete